MNADHPTKADGPQVRLHDVKVTGDTVDADVDGDAVQAAVARAVALALESAGSPASRPAVDEVAAGVSDLVSRQVVLPDTRD